MKKSIKHKITQRSINGSFPLIKTACGIAAVKYFDTDRWDRVTCLNCLRVRFRKGSKWNKE